MIDYSQLITKADKEQAAHEKACATARAKRDALLADADNRRSRHNDEVALGLTPSEPIEPLLQYIQALRNVPQQAGFPENIEWPTCEG